MPIEIVPRRPFTSKVAVYALMMRTTDGLAESAMRCCVLGSSARATAHRPIITMAAPRYHLDVAIMSIENRRWPAALRHGACGYTRCCVARPATGLVADRWQ